MSCGKVICRLKFSYAGSFPWSCRRLGLRPSYINNSRTFLICGVSQLERMWNFLINPNMNITSCSYLGCISRQVLDSAANRYRQSCHSMNEFTFAGRVVTLSNYFITSFHTGYECRIVLGRLQFTTRRAVRRLRGNTGAHYFKNLLRKIPGCCKPKSKPTQIS